jgi:hypothetical protein
MTGGLVLRRQTADLGYFFRADGTKIELSEADMAALVAKYSM